MHLYLYVIVCGLLLNEGKTLKRCLKFDLNLVTALDYHIMGHSRRIPFRFAIEYTERNQAMRNGSILPLSMSAIEDII